MDEIRAAPSLALRRAVGGGAADRRRAQLGPEQAALERVHDARNGLRGGSLPARGAVRPARRRLVSRRLSRRRLVRPGDQGGPRGGARARRGGGRGRSRTAAPDGGSRRRLRNDRLAARAHGGEEGYGRRARGHWPAARSGGVRQRDAGDPGRSRPDLRGGPAQGRGDRAPDRAARAARRLRALVRRPDAVHRRRLDDHRDARDRLDRRALHDDGDLRHEPRSADRARDRDRLLAPDRLSLPRRARARRPDGRGDRADDGNRRPGGRLLGRDGRDRPGAPALHAAAVHGLDGCRRLPDSAAVDPRGAHAPARPPLALRAARDEAGARRRLPPRPATPARASLRRDDRRRAGALGSARPLDHAQAAALPRRRSDGARGRGRARARSPADAGLRVWHPAVAGIDPGLQRPPRGRRARRAGPDPDPRRLRSGERDSYAGDPERDRRADRLGAPRSRGRPRRLRAAAALHRPGAAATRISPSPARTSTALSPPRTSPGDCARS